MESIFLTFTHRARYVKTTPSLPIFLLFARKFFLNSSRKQHSQIVYLPLLFADDLILFSKSDLPSAHSIIHYFTN